MSFLTKIKWNEAGLVPVITQNNVDNKVLMLAWMNAEALQLTIKTGFAVYWSRSRQKLWYKGEESGNQQAIKSIRLDCDKDVILLSVIQKGGIACHTGRKSCFFYQLTDGKWQITDKILKDPSEIYSK